jgi:molecular chaperone DnaK
MKNTIIGIDLGTTNSEVAIIEQGQATVISTEGKKLLPSFVGLDDQGQVLVGESARNQYMVYPERTIKSIKRLMGQNTHIQLGEQSYTPQEISALILKQLKINAEQYLGYEVTQAVITVPAYFSDAQRQATREAGEIAGLEVVRIINEPTAAALAYGSNDGDAKKIMVYDLGGGTFDVSVVNVQSGIVEVLSSHGDNHLGGDDFDQQILNYLLNHIQSTYDIDASTNSKALARLTRAAENAKLKLSDEPYCQIEEEYLLDKDGTAIHLSVELSRMEYEDMINDYIQATLDAVHIALKGAKLGLNDIDEILLVGGSTRTPIIRERLFQEFDFEPHGEVDPDLCVALGAATQAGIMSGEQIDKILVDITPYTYGTSAIGTLNGEYYPFTYIPLIHKNSALPIRKTEAFMTYIDGQEKVEVSIYQGEDPDALNNIRIGEFLIEGLRDVPAGNIITLTLDLDLNGILNVSAQEKATGLQKNITIKNALTQFEGNALEHAQQRVTSLFGQMEKDPALFTQEQPTEQAKEIIQAQQLIKKAESFFDQIDAEDKEDIVDLIETLQNCIDAGDIAGLQEPMDQLNDIIFYLES